MSRILVAPTAYKGTMSPAQVCETIASVARSYGHEAVELPLADGGDGTIESLHLACGGDLHDIWVPGPTGDIVEALWLKLGDIAIVELASACGIQYLKSDELSPLFASTDGLGVVLKHCLDSGLKDIVVAIGGSASTDGGSGALRALGAKILDDSGNELAHGGGALANAATIDLSALDKYKSQARIRIACDVTNPLLGTSGTAQVFAKQKGADDYHVLHLESALSHYANLLEHATGKQMRDATGSGAAGGTAFGLACALDAEIISGFDFIAELTNLQNEIANCSLVISGEGKLDQQSIMPDTQSGKVIGKLIDLCRIYDKPLWLICGQVDAEFGINYNWRSVGIEKLQVAAPSDRHAAVSDIQKMTQNLFSTLICLLLVLMLAIGQSSAIAGELEIPPAGISSETIKKFNAGAKLLESGDYQQACDIYAKIVKDSPGWGIANLMYGTALLKVGKTEEALAELLKAETATPDKEQVLVNLGGAYQSLGQRDKALEKFQRYLKLYPNGTYTQNLQDLSNLLLTEQARTKGAVSSKGQDNYFEEAISLGAARWNSAQMPLPIFIESGVGKKGYKESFADALKQAFTDWAAASGGKLSLKFINDPGSALITCKWVDSPNQLIDFSEGGEAMPARMSNGNMSKSALTILTVTAVDQREPSEEYMHYICLHEVGHILGLYSHSSQIGDVMFSVLPAKPSGLLSERDKKTMFMLYAAPDSILKEHPLLARNAALQGHDSSPHNRAIGLNAQGYTAMESKNLKEAVRCFEEAVKLAPDLGYISMNLASAYYNTGITEFNAGRSAQNYFSLAINCARNNKHYDLAKQFCEQTIQLAKSCHDDASKKKYEAIMQGLETGK